ncbi:MAG: hypothetical protein RsTaC01_0107 [Candidatus Paraimprobicoccus trichonymphae]|uniref:Uncharacterized protein n=1 Tax=Candidatus Paraimprobicoccus trichonymphae TaxID=3033793 RepID=A0AA48L192_9FIRM|nr:MAG: hypothetical protein RsTaC01_0107 [Candidatus Paraimprobicoccus trichonymphae]
MKGIKCNKISSSLTKINKTILLFCEDSNSRILNVVPFVNKKGDIIGSITFELRIKNSCSRQQIFDFFVNCTGNIEYEFSREPVVNYFKEHNLIMFRNISELKDLLNSEEDQIIYLSIGGYRKKFDCLVQEIMKNSIEKHFYNNESNTLETLLW